MSFMMMPLYYMSEEIELPTPSGSSYSVQKQDSPTQKAYQLLPKNQFPDKCAVCRNQSIGYCYNVPSCSGCKTFFRRTIVDGKRFICMNEKNCLEGTEPIGECLLTPRRDDMVVQDVSKRMCRACRFAKCVEVGMNPSAIRAAVKTSEGYFLLEEVVKKQKSRLRDNSMSTNEDFLAKMIGKLSLLEDETDKLHKHGIPTEFIDLRTISEVLAYPVATFNSHQIPNLTPALEKSIRNTCITFMTNGVLAVIEYSKSFNFSSKLDLETRIRLIKHVALLGSIMASASFSMHLRKSEALLWPDGSAAGFITDCLAGERFAEYSKQLQKTLHAFLSNKVDRVEYMLLKAIAISNPAISGLSRYEQDVIESERNIYGRALFDYCILQHGVTNGPARLAALLSLISVVEMQSKRQKDFYVMMKATTTERNCKTPVRNAFDEVMDP